MNFSTLLPGIMVFLAVVPGSVHFALAKQLPPAATGNGADNSRQIRLAVDRLIAIQEEDGAWPYEGVYRVGGRIPVGYRVGGTAIVCTALLNAPLEDRTGADQSIRRGLELILAELEHPLMKPIRENRYDVRVWGHIYSLELFARLKAGSRFPDFADRYQPWLDRLVAALVEEELDGGGWNYASRDRQAPFVTAPALQALILARAGGTEVPQGLFDRGVGALNLSRGDHGGYAYSGPAGRREEPLPGSIARNAVCESTLQLLGAGDAVRLRASVDAFHDHWDELEKRRKKTGTHEPPFGIAPYYFYYGHRYLAQAISLLPVPQQAEEYARFEAVLMKTKDDDDTWNDRVFERSRAFGTAMGVLALCRLPPPDPCPPAAGLQRD